MPRSPATAVLAVKRRNPQNAVPKFSMSALAIMRSSSAVHCPNLRIAEQSADVANKSRVDGKHVHIKRVRLFSFEQRLLLRTHDGGRLKDVD